jgi:hypothetical protein
MHLVPAEDNRQTFVASGANKKSCWPRTFDGVVEKEFDAAQSDGTGAAGPFFYILAV